MKRSGQSLLELVIASGIISTAVIASLALITRTVDLGLNSRSKIEAANHAREGLEVVRMIRDSNLLKADMNVIDGDPANPANLTKWDDTGVTAGAGNGYVAMSGDYVLDFTPAGGWVLVACGGGCPTNSTLRPIWIDSSGGLTFARQNCGGTCGTKSEYNRIITITPQPAEAVTIAGTNYSISYLSVTSTTFWGGGGTSSSITMSTRLYNLR